MMLSSPNGASLVQTRIAGSRPACKQLRQALPVRRTSLLSFKHRQVVPQVVAKAGAAAGGSAGGAGGNVGTWGSANTSPLQPDLTVDLPALSGAYLSPKAAKDLQSVINHTPQRAARADIYLPTDSTAASSARGAIIFAHAFVQPSYSYVSVIRQLQAAGWVVVAPITDVFDVLGRDIGMPIDQRRADTKLQSKLQAALIVDVLRAHQMVMETPKYSELVDKIIFMGHSLGGACSVIAAAKVQYDKIRGVAVMSPAVREMQKTPVNDDIWLLNGDAASITAAETFFKEEFPEETPLALISSRRDNIAPPDDIKRLFVVATVSRQGEDVALFSIDGNHFGYENELDLPNRVNFDGAALKLGPINISLAPLDRPLAGLINVVNKTIVSAIEYLQYKSYNPATSFLLGNSEQQEEQNLEVLKSTMAAMVARQPLATVTVGGGIAVETEPTPADVARVTQNEPRDNQAPVLWLNLLLSSYSGLQLLNTLTAFNLLQEAYGDFETRLGLLILAGLSFSLTYENALLVAGRRFYPNNLSLLQELSKWRFLAHSGAPLALVAGLNMAGRAGVEWAADPTKEGLIGLLILAVVAVSSIRNSLFLEITPVWNRGILRFSYAQGATDFTRVIPVILTTVVLVILGWQSYQEDASLLPFFVGPLGAFILNALPSGKDGQVDAKLPPQFVLGNGGEVLLFGSLVLTEVLLHMQGK